jgi:hypothetical protein
MSKKGDYPTAGLVLLVILLTMMYAHAMMRDRRNGKLLRSVNCPKDIETHISDTERCRVEQIIREYKNRRSMNKSQSQKIVRDVILGTIRGALGGAVLGGEAGIIPGIVAFGSLNGILSWSGAHVNGAHFVNPKDTSAY